MLQVHQSLAVQKSLPMKRGGQWKSLRRGEGGGSFHLLPGDHGAGLGMGGGGGGGAELREAAVARLQAGHGAPEGTKRRSAPYAPTSAAQHSTTHTLPLTLTHRERRSSGVRCQMLFFG